MWIDAARPHRPQPRRQAHAAKQRTAPAASPRTPSYRLGLIGSDPRREDVHRRIAKLQGKPDPLLKIGETDGASRKHGQIWALRDINLEAKGGEIIGRNGAGKSALRKASREQRSTIGPWTTALRPVLRLQPFKK